MTTTTVRYALISVMVTMGLLVGTAATGSAAARAAVTFGVGRTSASAPTAPSCLSGADTCASSDPDVALAWSSAVSTAGCRFRLTIAWGDGKAPQTVNLSGAAAGKVWPVTHTYPGRVSARRPYRISALATVVSDAQARGCSIESAATTFTLLCTDQQLSGASWNPRFPGGNRDVTALNDTFRPGVEAFIDAMTDAGITVSPQSTMRSPQRSYLMHFSYLVSKQQIAPQDVPAYVPVAGEKAARVCWLHRTASGQPDTATSVRAAAGLLSALGVDSTLRTAPALHSRHNTGDAIDMRTQWPASTLKIKRADGTTVKITTRPQDGTNAQLIAVGATYGVRHFSPATVDRNHWSSDGH
ncbi:hypothetical protein GCM10022223_15630 [Kineosporia mesophila]|uniref:Uncharacterized protein n=1 Tax=Kineosporia mesophila TaxID=566012 RepID=A0ABP6ZBB9_9ACTN|nr:hypothetical protein [Kineosporia mesophila]MCD5353038.1 hypothetical protein [Kineosporia mesophila]